MPGWSYAFGPAKKPHVGKCSGAGPCIFSLLLRAVGCRSGNKIDLGLAANKRLVLFGGFKYRNPPNK